MGLGDIFGGGLAGAATGGMLGGAPGAVIGGLGGAFMGYQNGRDRDASATRRQASMDEAMKRLQEFSAQQRQQRAADLDKIMSFYGPAQQQLTSMYGPQAAPGGMPGPQMPQRPAPGGGMPFPIRPRAPAGGRY